MSDLKIFTTNIEPSAVDQINLLLAQDAFKDCKVRIMPDVHAGAGCVIGFTANLGDKVIPNIVGVDIGCGMTWYNTHLKDINFAALDTFIRMFIPSGHEVYKGGSTVSAELLKSLVCYKELHDVERLNCSIGTLGGGNHFIEVDRAANGELWIIVHSGSRNLGNQVCKIYQQKAIDHCSYYNEMRAEQQYVIEQLKSEGRQTEIQTTLQSVAAKYANLTKLPRDLCYLEGQDREDYLDDMKLGQEWASLSRLQMLMAMLCFLGLTADAASYHETIHNYIDNNNIVRKGAVKAAKDELVLIPMNMRDGCIIGRGKGNQDWNESAPHGAGRMMPRGAAKETLSLDDYEQSMKGIYTTSVCRDTIDESPAAYKPIDEIVACVKDTIDIVEIIKPVYNFKAIE